jgi:hypothetical protein
MAVCPRCRVSVSSVKVERLEGRWAEGRLACIVLCCPTCSVVLSAHVNPLVIKTDTVSELMDDIRQELYGVIDEIREELDNR